MTNKVDKIIVKNRVNKLKELGKQLKIRAYQNTLCKKVRVVVEKDYMGYSDDYFKVKVNKGDINSFCSVIINECNMKNVILGGINVKENFDNRGFCSRGLSSCES
jgi:tRNA A37 methylthiotransferase MiaB